MQTVPSIVKELFDKEAPQLLLIKDTATNGNTVTITEADVMANGFNIDRYTSTGNKLEVGTAIAAEMTLKLNNFDGRFDLIHFEGMELKVQLGVAEGLGEPFYLDCGLFICEEQPRTANVITIHALDRMTIFDKYEPTIVGWDDQSGNDITDASGNDLVFAAELVFPCTVVNLIEQVCEFCGATLVQRPWHTMPNYNLTLNGMPQISQKVSYRDIIRWCAGIMASCAYMNYQGELDFIWYGGPDSGQTQYVSTPDMRYSSDLAENDVTITGVAYTNSQGATLVSGTPDYALDLTGNYLIGGQAATILPVIKNEVNGFTYRPFSAEVVTAPYLEPFDIILFTDKNGVNHNVLITNMNYGLNTPTKLEGKGETTAVSELSSPSAMTPEQGTIIEQVTQKVVDLDDSLDQESIFNRLTNNGQEEAVILNNGHIYINASYINTGILNANLIRAGKIQDAQGKSFWDMITGLLNVVGTFSAETETSEGTFTMRLAEGGLSLLLDNIQVAKLTWSDYGISLSGKNSNGAMLDATVVNSQGEMTNGAFVAVQPDGNVYLQGNNILVGAVDEIPAYGETETIEYVKDVDFENQSVTFGQIQFINGVAVSIT